MLFARLVLLVQALVWGALGVLYWVRPYEMANLSGMLLMEPSAVSDARVFYGGHSLPWRCSCCSPCAGLRWCSRR